MVGRGQGRGRHEPSGVRRALPFLWGAVALALVIVAYLTAQVRPTRTLPERWLADALAPAQGLLARAARRLGEGVGLIGELARLRRENQALRQQLQALQLQLQLLGRAAVENDQLRAALRLPSVPGWRPLPAEVIQRQPSRWYAQVVVNRGEGDGVAIDAPVVASSGVVGNVVSLTGRTATVRLLTDVQASVGGLVTRTRDLVLVQGTGEGARLHVKSLSDQASFAPGDLVVTSGLGGVYPRGLVVGTIREVRELPGGLGREGWMDPAADVNRLAVVYILLAERSGE